MFAVGGKKIVVGTPGVVPDVGTGTSVGATYTVGICVGMCVGLAVGEEEILVGATVILPPGTLAGIPKLGISEFPFAPFTHPYPCSLFVIPS